MIGHPSTVEKYLPPVGMQPATARRVGQRLTPNSIEALLYLSRYV